MKAFSLDNSMTTMGGVFYPTGHVVLMLPGREAAERAGKALTDAGFAADGMSLIDPDTIMGQIAQTVGTADIPLPSAGTEGDTVRRMTQLAAEGQWGLLVHAPKSDDSDRVVELLQGMPVSFAQKYRMLVIQDLEPEGANRA